MKISTLSKFKKKHIVLLNNAQNDSNKILNIISLFYVVTMIFLHSNVKKSIHHLYNPLTTYT